MENDLNMLAAKYRLPVDFVKKFYNTMTDKRNIELGLKMFVDGTLSFFVASGDTPFCVKDILHEVSDNYRKANKKRLEAIARMDKANEYLKSCECVCYPLEEKETNAQECVYIKDGVVVSFAHYEPKEGGFYAFNNEGQGMLDWRPQVHLANLRRLSYPYFNEIKKAAFKSPEEWFE